jgi:hypothetical protein
VAEVAKLHAALGEEHARDGLAAQHVVLVLFERRALEVDVREGVVAQLHPRVEPRAQKLRARVRLAAAVELPLVDEADGGDAVALDALQQPRRDAAHVFQLALRRGQIVEGDGHLPGRLCRGLRGQRRREQRRRKKNPPESVRQRCHGRHLACLKNGITCPE